MAFIDLNTRDGVAVLALNRPPVNAITREVIDDAMRALDELSGNAAHAPFVFTGSGSSFSAGLDLRVIPAMLRDEQKSFLMAANRFAARLYTWPAPVVGAINGHAMAAGFVLALTPDVRIGAAGDAKFAVTEIKAGIPFPAVPNEILTAELAPHVARSLTMTGESITPIVAREVGVLDEVVSSDELLDHAADVARKLAAYPAAAYAKIKAQLRGRAIARIQAILDADVDPLFDAWLDEQTAGASEDVLRNIHRP